MKSIFSGMLVIVSRSEMFLFVELVREVVVVVLDKENDNEDEGLSPSEPCRFISTLELHTTSYVGETIANSGSSLVSFRAGFMFLSKKTV